MLLGQKEHALTMANNHMADVVQQFGQDWEAIPPEEWLNGVVDATMPLEDVAKVLSLTAKEYLEKRYPGAKFISPVKTVPFPNYQSILVFGYAEI